MEKIQAAFFSCRGFLIQSLSQKSNKTRTTVKNEGPTKAFVTLVSLTLCP